MENNKHQLYDARAIALEFARLSTDKDLGFHWMRELDALDPSGDQHHFEQAMMHFVEVGGLSIARARQIGD